MRFERCGMVCFRLAAFRMSDKAEVSQETTRYVSVLYFSPIKPLCALSRSFGSCVHRSWQMVECSWVIRSIVEEDSLSAGFADAFRLTVNRRHGSSPDDRRQQKALKEAVFFGQK